ncbi:MAG: FMN-binding protein [Candidatus Riflebacteria bacterium]
MTRGKPGVVTEIWFVLLLSTACVFILLITRVGIGARSEVSARTVRTALQLLTTQVPSGDEEAYAVFSRRFSQKSSGRIKTWQNQDQLSQWVFEASGAGMWGEMTLVGVVDLETETMTGLQVIGQNETAGLGSRITEPVFAEQFVNLSLQPRVEMVRARFRNNQFDAVSGATVTSKALETLINKAISQVRENSRKKS